jgi:S1-C subfamily serine protease
MDCLIRTAPLQLTSANFLGRWVMVSGLIVAAWFGQTGGSVAGEAGIAAPGTANSASPATRNTAQQAVQTALKQVYRLLVETNGAAKGGTAFLVSGKRVIATNHHVIEDGTAYSVGFLDRSGVAKRIPLRLLAIFPQKDLALLEALDDLPGEPMQLAEDLPAVATELFAIGFPAAADPLDGPSWTRGDDTTFFIPSVVKGYVSRVLANRWFSSQLQHQTPIIPGYSGGPLIDPGGVVLAVSTAIHKEAGGISYGVLAGDVADFLKACALPTRKMLIGAQPHAVRRRLVGRPDTAMPKVVKKAAQPDIFDMQMLAKGNDFLERGDIVAARLIYHYLVDRRDLPEAYAGMAKTYDPIFLNEKKVVGVAGDFAKAHAFYKEAERLSRSMAIRDVPIAAAPSAGGCNDSVCRLVNSAQGPVIACKDAGPDANSAAAAHR